MDYKKAYEDVLERANGIYNENPSSSTAKFVCGQIFPEIKESEDERIRSFLYEFIKICGWSEKQYPPKEKCLAYLEKQKEQKPESCDCSRDEESYTNGIHHVLMNPEAYGLIKQQPAEWSEEEKETLEKLHRLLVICRGEKKFIQEADYNKMDNLLKSLRPSWKPSEEHFQGLRRAITKAEKGSDAWNSLTDLYEHLKKL